MLEGCSDLAQYFLRLGFAHLSADLPVKFRLEELCPNSSSLSTRLMVNFTNIFDVYYLFGKGFWWACEFIAFTTYNIFTNFENIFPTSNGMQSLPTNSARTTWRRSEEEAQVKMAVKAMPGLMKLVLP
ncbi:hypothetical protein D1007_27757 [Hordeum vulgare]|nr:hypothetical protein D1007_27757 [Hordeum vulgare]